MTKLVSTRSITAAAAAAAAAGAAAMSMLPFAQAAVADDGPRDGIRHVLLISVDGMHQVDLDRYVASHPGSALAKLVRQGVQYTNNSTARPSDSYPGLLAFVTGGSPLSHGVFYDDTYDKTLFPPVSTLGKGVQPCTGAPGTEVTNFEALDWDLTKLDGGVAPAGFKPPPGIAGFDSRPLNKHIDPRNLALAKVNGVCSYVYPHGYMKNGTNTVFELIHKAGLRTAWSDKHPAYEILNGPSDTGLDELYAPEINSTSVTHWLAGELKGASLVQPPNCDAANASNCDLKLPNGKILSFSVDWTTDPALTRRYDEFKVDVLLRWIHGRDRAGSRHVGTPAIFGMNFQAVSVAQKVTVAMQCTSNPSLDPLDPGCSAATTTRGGYADASGTPTHPLEQSLQYVDAALGRMLQALEEEHLLESTLFIVGAKHGQSPNDVSQLHMLAGSKNAYATADVTDPADILGSIVAQETADDVSLLWLNHSSDTGPAVSLLQANAAAARIDHIFSGSELKAVFGDPAGGRVPDIIIQPKHGTIYSKSAAKLSEHGGFVGTTTLDDNTHTLLVVSNPGLDAKTVSAPTTNMQVAPTILKALGLNPQDLSAVKREGTKPLPGLDLSDD